MELGNMIFGHSRGQYSMERGDGFEDELSRLFNAYSPDRDNSWREYGEEFENDVFEVHPYYWGDCTCGFDERFSTAEEEWHKLNEHAPACYQTELQSRLAAYKRESGYDVIYRSAFGERHSLMDGFDTEVSQDGPMTSMIMHPRTDDAMDAWRKAHDELSKFEDRLYKELCAKYRQSRTGCAVHCTCEYDTKWREFCEGQGNHDTKCPIVLPNFRFKPTGYEIRWYKYPLRDSYQSHELTLAQFRELIDACISSL